MKTRAAFIGTLFSLFMITVASGQVEIGVRTGVQFNDVNLKGIGILDNIIPEPQMTAGATAAAFAIVPLGRNFYFETGLGYARKGFRMSEGVDVNVFGIDVPFGATATTRLDYLELPVMLQWKSGEGPVQFFLKGGPYVGYAFHGDIRVQLNSILDIDIGTFPFNVNGALYKPWEFGLKAGTGVQVNTGDMGSFFAEASFTQGLTDFLDEPVVDIRMKNFGVGMQVGYALNF